MWSPEFEYFLAAGCGLVLARIAQRTHWYPNKAFTYISAALFGVAVGYLLSQ